MTHDRQWPTSEERPWASPGVPPWIASPPPQKRGLGWAGVVLVLGTVLICCSGFVILGLWGTGYDPAAPVTPSPSVSAEATPSAGGLDPAS